MYKAILGLLISVSWFNLPQAKGAVVKNKYWSLDDSIQRLLSENEIVKSTNAQVESEKELVTESRLPNPEIEISATNQFKVQTGNEGYDYYTGTITQALPLADLIYGKDIAEFSYQKAIHENKDFLLKLKYQFALLYRELQYKQGSLELAESELNLLRKQISSKSQKLVRFQNPLDKSKMQLIINNANISKRRIEEEIHELEAKIKIYLKIESNVEYNVPAIEKLKVLEVVNTDAKVHPSLKSLSLQKESLISQISREKVDRFGDVEISVFQEKQFIFNKPMDTHGAMIKFKIPLWDWKSSQINSLKAKKTEIDYKITSARRNLRGQVSIISEHYKHLLSLQKLITDTQIPKAKVLLDKTIKSYSAGQTNILSLIDSYQEYFGAKRSFLELVHDGWKEYEELRYLTNDFDKMGRNK